MRCGWLCCLESWAEVCRLSAVVYIKRKFTQGTSVNSSSLAYPDTTTITETSVWSKSTSIKTSWSLSLRCWLWLEASHVMHCVLWFVQNIIVSDCPCFYWIRPALLMREQINKQAVLCLSLWWSNYREKSTPEMECVLCAHTSWYIYTTFVLACKYCS